MYNIPEDQVAETAKLGRYGWQPPTTNITHATRWTAFRTLLIHSYYGGDLTPQSHNCNDEGLSGNVTNIYETICEPWRT